MERIFGYAIYIIIRYVSASPKLVNVRGDGSDPRRRNKIAVLGYIYICVKDMTEKQKRKKDNSKINVKVVLSCIF